VMSAVIAAVAVVIAILRIVLSSQEVVLRWSCLILASAASRAARGEYFAKGTVALFPRQQARSFRCGELAQAVGKATYRALKLGQLTSSNAPISHRRPLTVTVSTRRFSCRSPSACRSRANDRSPLFRLYPNSRRSTPREPSARCQRFEGRGSRPCAGAG